MAKFGEHGETGEHGEIGEHGECLALYHGEIGEHGKIWRTWRNLENMEK